MKIFLRNKYFYVGIALIIIITVIITAINITLIKQEWLQQPPDEIYIAIGLIGSKQVGIKDRDKIIFFLSTLKLNIRIPYYERNTELTWLDLQYGDKPIQYGIDFFDGKIFIRENNNIQKSYFVGKDMAKKIEDFLEEIYSSN